MHQEHEVEDDVAVPSVLEDHVAHVASLYVLRLRLHVVLGQLFQKALSWGLVRAPLRKSLVFRRVRVLRRLPSDVVIVQVLC